MPSEHGSAAPGVRRAAAALRLSLRAAARVEVAFLLFSGAVFVFHLLPAASGGVDLARAHELEHRTGLQVNDFVDLVTPFAVVGAAALVLYAARARWTLVSVAVIAAILYVDGHGIHLSANSIAATQPVGETARVTFFWDERFGHIEWHLGWIGLLATFSAADRTRRLDPVTGAAAILFQGAILFGSAVEGGTWWLVLAVAPLFVAWAAWRRTHVAIASAAALAGAAGAIGIWALWHDGMPQFSDLGLL